MQESILLMFWKIILFDPLWQNIEEIECKKVKFSLFFVTSQFTYLQNIFNFFKSNYLINKETEEKKTKEEVLANINNIKKDYLTFLSLCMIFESICQYDIYLRLSFIEIAKELYLKY